LLSNAAYDVAREAIRENKPGIHWVAASNVMDAQIKGEITDPDTPTYHYVQTLKEAGKTRLVFNPTFFSEADSRSPSRAGFLGAILGSIFTMAICLMVAFPLGVMTAVYLEEFAPKNRLTDIIEVNINNLAAVPSIVFGLLGLAVFLHFFDLPRSAPVVGGLTLALMTLPVIIISTRVALKAIPDSIRQAALALGATRLQAVTQHVIPLAIPGIMTGTILGAARALGETAPLLMIGMVAFIADVPQGFTDPATVMPVQIYIWASSPESGFVEKTSAGILTLLVFLLLMNATAIYIRKKFEVRW
jgi:phosphate transport system permease protein